MSRKEIVNEKHQDDIIEIRMILDIFEPTQDQYQIKD